jgi:4a-hydroxytetrahydrobiopterin dehydratase
MWQDKNNSLYREFKFKNFKEAFAFMQKVAKAAEEYNHHPKWLNDWNRVDIWLSTHEEGAKITNKDHEMSRTIDKLYEESI